MGGFLSFGFAFPFFTSTVSNEQTSTQVTRCCYGSRLRAIDIAYVAMKRRTDLSSSEERKDSWLPARQSLSGKRMFQPDLGSGNGRGLINEFWSTETLLFEKAKWAVLLKTAESDKEMKEGVHYEFTDWKPTSILFARGKRNPILGSARDDASSLKATKVILHVGEIHPSFRIGSSMWNIDNGAVSNKRPRLM